MEDLAEHVVRMSTDTSTDIVLESAVIPQFWLKDPPSPGTEAAAFVHSARVHHGLEDCEYASDSDDEPPLDLLHDGLSLRQFRVRCTVPVRTYALETGSIALDLRQYDGIKPIREWTPMATFRSAEPAIDFLFRLATTRRIPLTRAFLRVGDVQLTSFTHHDDRSSIAEIIRALV